MRLTGAKNTTTRAAGSSAHVVRAAFTQFDFSPFFSLVSVFALIRVAYALQAHGFDDGCRERIDL